jgi:uncharacterized phage protein (TIGR01671 family)
MRQTKYRSWISSIQQFVYFKNGNYSWKRKTDDVNVFNWDNAQQFTGLLDKQGVEIYEGDIVKATYGTVLNSDWTQGEVSLEYYSWCLTRNGMAYDTFDNLLDQNLPMKLEPIVSKLELARKVATTKVDEYLKRMSI